MRYFLLLFICCLSIPAFAHRDFYVSRNYRNIKTSIKTGFLYEEINKTLIIGQLAEKLSKEFNYKDTILLHFDHHYTIPEEVATDYFVSFNNDKNRIEIKVHGNKYEVVPVLKLLEYAIRNTSTIQKQQKTVHYEKHYNNIDLMTISDKSIRKIIGEKDNELIKKIISHKIYRPDGIVKKEHPYGFTYYWQNNKFYLIEKTHYEEVPIIQLENIYTLYNMGLNMVVFDTNKSFYHINAHYYKQPKLSRRLIIEDNHEYYRPYKVSDIGGDRITVQFDYYKENFEIKNVTLIYFPEEDLLIQDLDEVVDEYLQKRK